AYIHRIDYSTVTSRPFLSCLQWSGDGQTPERGVPSAATQLPGDVRLSHVKWFSTMNDFNPRDGHNWPASTQEWGAVSLGSLDVGLRAITCSPSNLTGNGGCVAAILSSNMDLSLWRAAKNTIKGEWAKLCKLTPFIAELASRESHSKAEQTLRSQITSLLWSSHADFDIIPAPCLDSSLLVTGTRAGTLMLFRFKQSSLEHVTTVKVSIWTPLKADESEIVLAYGTADGSVGLAKIIQILSSAPFSSGFSLDHTIETRVEISDPAVFQPDNTGMTALSWILPLENMVLVRATPGVLSLWSGVSPTLGWSGRRSLRLCTQKMSVGSSSLQPVSGLHYAQHEGALFVSLFDGSIHVINSLIVEPKLSNVSRDVSDQTSEGLSGILPKVSKRDVNRVSGVIPYDDYSVAVWVQESAQPADFDYKYDVLHESTFVGNCPIVQTSDTTCSHELSTSGSTPLHLLRSIFLHLQELLELQPVYTPKPCVPSWSGDYKQHLYGCNVLLSLRLRLSVPNLLGKPHAQPVFVSDSNVLRTISFIILRTLCRHLSAVTTCQRDDIPFLIRIALQASLPTAPSDLRSDAEILINTLSSNIPSFFMKNKRWRRLYLESGSEASCSRGHSWGETCIGCTRKAIRPLSSCIPASMPNWLPSSAQSWVVEEFLESVSRCLFCGNNFTSIF
ncbi:hypothetical protein B0H13DRAFT_2085318, partial [Mycena leptocephala]